MLLWNYLITPLYMTGYSRADVAGLLPTLFLPFNLAKGGMKDVYKRQARIVSGRCLGWRGTPPGARGNFSGCASLPWPTGALSLIHICPKLEGRHMSIFLSPKPAKDAKK